MTKSPEQELGELAIRKARLNEQLAEVRREIKKKAKQVELPVTVVINNHAVTIGKPPYGDNPPTKVTRVVCVNPCEDS